MDRLEQALRGARSTAAAPGAALEHAIVVGAGGALGSALLGEALARFQTVSALVAGPLASALRGFVALPLQALQAGKPLGAAVGFIVFERARHSHGRDDAFVRPQPHELPQLAAALEAAGVKRLLVVVPHSPALLPQALKAGFASADEAAVAALGFEQLLLLRAAQPAGAGTAGSALQRLATWWLGQLRWLVPLREQPLRAVTLAALAVQLARMLPAAPPGTRVVPPELLWQASQGDAEAVLSAWLGRP